MEIMAETGLRVPGQGLQLLYLWRQHLERMSRQLEATQPWHCEAGLSSIALPCMDRMQLGSARINSISRPILISCALENLSGTPFTGSSS